ncbi:hypothetical protein SAMN04489752_2558 [Brevibacterium siliguriense]|uniref:Alcohol dehydrogenase GroES-like domain-containing protein n=1 Tax=Brevibacterium siliguriense TaxID=1136497 RepID=A0A1H1V6J1_9MICO|nr:hypothetical protein SAMN04489752_2558 [Brevibacterium siliguriense]
MRLAQSCRATQLRERQRRPPALHRIHNSVLEEVSGPALATNLVKIMVAASRICGSDLSLYEYTPSPRASRCRSSAHQGTMLSVTSSPAGSQPLARTLPMSRSVPSSLCAPTSGMARAQAVCAVASTPANRKASSASPAGAADSPTTSSHIVTPSTSSATTSARMSQRRSSRHPSPGMLSSSTALIVEVGPIGFGVLCCLNARGVSDLVMSKPSAPRRESVGRPSTRRSGPRATKTPRGSCPSSTPPSRSTTTRSFRPRSTSSAATRTRTRSSPR